MSVDIKRSTGNTKDLVVASPHVDCKQKPSELLTVPGFKIADGSPASTTRLASNACTSSGSRVEGIFQCNSLPVLILEPVLDIMRAMHGPVYRCVDSSVRTAIWARAGRVVPYNLYVRFYIRFRDVIDVSYCIKQDMSVQQQ